MARGTIVWRCRKCGNKSEGTCQHPRAGYSIVYRFGERQKWKSVGRNKKVAEARLVEIMGKIHDGSFRAPTHILFREFCERWLAQQVEGSVKPSTLRFYRWLLFKHLIPAFGDSKLTALTSEAIQGFLSSKLKAGLSTQTARHLLVALRLISKWAVRWGYLVQNPARDVDTPSISKREMDHLEPEEIRRLLDQSDEPYRTLFMTAVLAGLRRGELLALRWSDVDWSQNLIFVRRSLFWRTTKEAGGGTSRWVYQSPKSEKSKRTIPVSPILRRSLELHRLNTIHQANPDNLIFARLDGRPLEPDVMVRQQFLPALTRAGLRQIRFHDLRHTAASLLIAQGEHPKTVQTILGHASSRTTFDVYGHLYHATLQAVGPKLDSQVFGAEPSQAPIHSVAPGDLLKVSGQ